MSGYHGKLRIIFQFVKFSACGITCFTIDFLLLLLLTEVFSINYLISAGISFTTATVINYFISVKWVYDTGGKAKGRFDIIVFVVLGAIGLLLNQIIMWSMVESLGWDYRFVKVISGVIVSFYNFITRKVFLERGNEKP